MKLIITFVVLSFGFVGLIIFTLMGGFGGKGKKNTKKKSDWVEFKVDVTQGVTESIQDSTEQADIPTDELAWLGSDTAEAEFQPADLTTDWQPTQIAEAAQGEPLEIRERLDTTMETKSPKKSGGLLKSNRLLKPTADPVKPAAKAKPQPQPAAGPAPKPPSSSTEIVDSFEPAALANSPTHLELLRVLVNSDTGEIVVEVDGQQYEAVSQIQERSIGQRILETVALMLKFTGGMIATASGLKTVPVPQAKLSQLPAPSQPEPAQPAVQSQPKPAQPAVQSQPKPAQPPAPSQPEPAQPPAPSQSQSAQPAQPAQPPAPLDPFATPQPLTGSKPTSLPPLSRPTRLSPIDEPEPLSSKGFFGRLRKPDTPPVEIPSFNLAAEIDKVVQRKLETAGIQTPVSIDSGLDGLLQITVAGQGFNAIDEVEPAEVKALIQEAIQEWESR